MNNYVEKIRRGDSLTNFHDVELRETVDNINRELTTDTTTIEGNPLNFSLLSAQHAKSTILSLEPIQDLHGYTKPWVGGAGKNKTDASDVTKDSSGYIIGANSSGKDWINENHETFPAGTYTISFYATNFASSSASQVTLFNNDTQVVTKSTSNVSRTIMTVTAESNFNKLSLYTNSNSGGKFTNIQFESGSTVTTYEPYENICPISGHTEIGILGCGKNLLPTTLTILKNANTDGTWTDNVYVLNNITWTVITDNSGNVIGINSNGNNNTLSASNIYLPLNTIPSGNFYFSGCPDGGGTDTYNLFVYDYTTSARAKRWDGTSNVLNCVKLSDYQQVKNDNTHNIMVRLRINPGVSITNKIWYPMVCASTATNPAQFEPYTKSNDITISLGQTVYGGTLDVENGVLVVDKQIVTITNNIELYGNWGDDNAPLFYYWQTGVAPYSDTTYPSENKPICNCYEIINEDHGRKMKDFQFRTEGPTQYDVQATRFYFRDSRFTTTSDFNAYIANNPIQIVYKLFTPITINLTPNEISLLEGVNNISTDGDKITLTYRDGKVATLGDLLDLEKKLSGEEPYGFIEHMDILDPAQRIEYIGKNKNYKPVTVNLSGDHLANYNEWYDFFVLKENKPYMIKADGTVDYALDPNDYTKKFDGSASDVADTTYTGGAFAWIPKIYKYEYVNGSNRYVYLSQKKLNDNYEAIGFIDEDGLEHDGVWIPMFYGTEITQSDTVKIMSLATGTPSESRDTATQKTYIENFSSKAKFFGGPIINVLADLLIMLGKNSDVQAVFGTGNSSSGNGAQYMKANACINGGAFYGSSTNTALNKAFHSLVLLTQNQWQRDPYTLCYKGEYIVSPYYKYDLTGTSYVNTGVFVTPPSSNNWVYPNKSVSVPHWGAVPVGPYSGSTTTGWADGQYTRADQLTDTTVRVVPRFANCADGRTGGVRCVSLGYAASGTYWSFGASPLLLSEEKTRA